MGDGADEAHGEPLVPARMINEAFYCERLLFLEWAQREWADNFFTAEGREAHARLDEGGGTLEGDDGAPRAVRSLELSSDELGLTAKIDLVEAAEDGSVMPIETKRGKAPDVPEGAYLPERAQLAAHVLLLRAHGYVCHGASIYFAGSRRRVPVTIDEPLLQQVREAVPRIRALVRRAEAPPPLAGSPKCDGCSLATICLPDEVTTLRSEAEPAPGVRRLVPARDDRVPLYVTETGARVGVDGGELVVRTTEAEIARVRITNTSHVSVFGNVQISTQALKRLFERGVDVSFFSRGGWLEGRASSFSSGNVDVRLAQVRAAMDDARALELARGFIEAKIRNARTILRRNHATVAEAVLFELEQLARKAKGAASMQELLGIEGTAARTYFGAFAGMLSGSLGAGFDWQGRNRRPPKDPVNALLSLAYALLARDVTHAVAHAGLDPLLGFYHRPRFGRPALALDLMEELRPILADSTVLTAINTQVVGPEDFARHPTGVALRPAGRRRFLEAYERRMDTLVTHPTFGYRISWRRTLEVQARLLARTLMGDVPRYPNLRPR
jgi:CRISPR-associated protein Cas1